MKKTVAEKRKQKKVEQMRELRKNSPYSSSGSTKWTTKDEIRFLLGRDSAKARVFILKYIETCKYRTKWPAMEKKTILRAAKKLLKEQKKAIFSLQQIAKKLKMVDRNKNSSQDSMA